MSLSAPKEFWNKRAIVDLMYKDTIVSIMKMSAAELGSRINLANTVLKAHDEGHGILSGKLYDDELYECAKHYKNMLCVVQNKPLQYDIKPNSSLGFGMDGGLRSYIA